jgi:DNA-binding Lrp family transcriptional regulator
MRSGDAQPTAECSLEVCSVRYNGPVRRTLEPTQNASLLTRASWRASPCLSSRTKKWRPAQRRTARVEAPVPGQEASCYYRRDISRRELARRAGISAPPCLRRVRRLEEAGVIRGYHADSDPQQLGWEITFFAIVGLDSQKELVLAAFEQLVANWPEVRECHMIRGGGDFLLKLVARDTSHENQLTQRLTGAPTVTRVQTLQTIRTSRLLSGVPL